MTNIEEKESLISKVKEVLFNYCPYTEDRLDLLDHGPSPEFDIHFCFGEDCTSVLFVYGTHRAKSGVSEYLYAKRIVELEEIEELIDFIKEDHKAMVYDKHDTNNKSAEFKFDITWGGEENNKGINCGTIGIILNFRGNPDLEKKYLYFLNEKYFESKDLWSKWEFTDSVFTAYVDSLEKEGLIKLLSDVDTESLRKIMKKNMRDIFESTKDNPKIKELFKKKI